MSLNSLSSHLNGDQFMQPLIAANATSSSNISIHGRWSRWLLVALNIFFLLIGQTAAVLLGRLYYDSGGSSIWLATLIQSGGFPILLPILLFFNRSENSTNSTTTPANHPSLLVLCTVYISLGLLLAGDNFIYSLGLLYLPVSTFSLICASQLAFNVFFSYFLNSQKITPAITNSVVLLTLSTTLLAFRASSSRSDEALESKYAIGFLCTVGAAAAYSLLLSLIQLCFQKLLKKESFYVVLDLQVKVSIVATSVCVLGLYFSGDWKNLKGEMLSMGRVYYAMVLLGSAIAWQLAYVGIVGLIFLVSSLFSNVIGTFGLPLAPIFAVIFFHEMMDGVKVIALLMGIWGFVSYAYESYIDESEMTMISSEVDVVALLDTEVQV